MNEVFYHFKSKRMICKRVVLNFKVKLLCSRPVNELFYDSKSDKMTYKRIIFAVWTNYFNFSIAITSSFFFSFLGRDFSTNQYFALPTFVFAAVSSLRDLHITNILDHYCYIDTDSFS